MLRNPHSVLDYIDVLDEELSRLSIEYAGDGHPRLSAELSNMKVICTHLRGLIERGTGEYSPLVRKREPRNTPKDEDRALPMARVVERRRKPPDTKR